MNKESKNCACGCGQTTTGGRAGHRRYKRGHNRRGVGKGWTQCGYKYISVNGVAIAEHRHILEQHLGRRLTIDEVVHHVNGDPLDNRIENLVVVSRAEHRRLHAGTKWKHWTAEEKARARELRQAGMSVQDIATALGRGFSSTISHVCERREPR